MYDDDYGTGALLAFWLVLLPFLFILAIAGYVIGSWFLMRIFDKAGVQGKWRAWVPVYNMMVFAKLGDLNPWVMLGAIVASSLLSQVPVIGWILGLASLAASVLAGWRVGLKLQKDWPYLLLWLIFPIGYFIWLGILAFGNSPWNPNIAPAPWRNSFLKDNVVWQGIPVQPGAPVGAAPAAAPAGYAPPAGYTQPPAGYTPPPAAYTPPPAPPAGPAAPPAPPAAAPPAAAEPPVTPPPAAAPPAATEPPASPDAPAAPEEPKP
jgi:hypothetical protein